MGASRAACDAGWIDHSYQVGLTGRTIAPNVLHHRRDIGREPAHGGVLGSEAHRRYKQ